MLLDQIFVQYMQQIHTMQISKQRRFWLFLYAALFTSFMEVAAQDRTYDYTCYSGEMLSVGNESILRVLCKLDKGFKGNIYWMGNEYDSHTMDGVYYQGNISAANSRYDGIQKRNIDDVKCGVLREGLKYKKTPIVWMVNGHYAMTTGYKGGAYRLQGLKTIGSSIMHLSFASEDVDSVIITNDVTHYVSSFQSQKDRDFLQHLRPYFCEIKLKPTVHDK